jgi:hypothetical protein
VSGEYGGGRDSGAKDGGGQEGKEKAEGLTRRKVKKRSWKRERKME